jgi:hypothetical protein
MLRAKQKFFFGQWLRQRQPRHLAHAVWIAAWYSCRNFIGTLKYHSELYDLAGFQSYIGNNS